VLAVLALGATFLMLRRVRGHSQLLDDAITRGKARFDEIVARELELRATELEQALALARSESLAALAEEERRIVDQRRRDVAERERDATARLGDALTATQQTVEQRLSGWSIDLDRLQERFATEVLRLASQQEQRTAETERRLTDEADHLQVAIDEQRLLVARTREELQRMARDLLQETTGELEQYAADRRRALQEIEERLRAREHGLQERIEREQSEAMQRVGAVLGDVEHRQIEQVRRVVSREATRFAEAAAVQFEQTIKTAREDAARRLRRELDLAIERFAREANGVIAEQVEQVARGAVQQVEARLASMPETLERQHDERVGTFERRVQDIEVNMRARLQEIASEAEAERELLERRLRDLTRKIDELATRA